MDTVMAAWQRWLFEDRKPYVSLLAFRDMCDRGEVEGVSPDPSYATGPETPRRTA